MLTIGNTYTYFAVSYISTDSRHTYLAKIDINFIE